MVGLDERVFEPTLVRRAGSDDRIRAAACRVYRRHADTRAADLVQRDRRHSSGGDDLARARSFPSGAPVLADRYRRVRDSNDGVERDRIWRWPARALCTSRLCADDGGYPCGAALRLALEPAPL